ncbi:hypothetical protein TRFO_30477 [Tritrichomonas foetus]|uniref:Lunapark zinc ribbon domain-containing protein n=1 Tax=Tritrichomonas foetus TaxID=1144522 RepID=A0A1J4JTH2_9EUKA|nr:hypothetical protein TRFO_30477 [Tritrichomonas foetus]|eukprot:OHT02415.1 hypothetical protein TRFO_30477 [Tritrichomonas foetus]
MGLFHSKTKLPLTEEIELLAQEEKILISRKRSSPTIFNKLIIFFLSLTVACLIAFGFVLVPTFISIFFLLLVALLKPFNVTRIEKEIIKTRNLKRTKAAELDEMAKKSSELYTELKKKEKESQNKAMDYSSYSPLCAIWDRLTHGYIYNPNALICPYCKANNGLYDMKKPIRYKCPNCNMYVNKNFEKAASYKVSTEKKNQ